MFELLLLMFSFVNFNQKSISYTLWHPCLSDVEPFVSVITQVGRHRVDYPALKTFLLILFYKLHNRLSLHQARLQLALQAVGITDPVKHFPQPRFKLSQLHLRAHISCLPQTPTLRQFSEPPLNCQNRLALHLSQRLQAQLGLSVACRTGP